MARMSRREQGLAVAAAAALFAVVVVHQAGLPALERWRSLEDRIEAAEVKLEKGRRLIDLASRIEAAHAKISPSRRETGSEQQEMGAFLREVETLARQNLLPITDLRPLPVEDRKSHRLFVVEMETRADAARLARFLYGVEVTAPALRVERMALTSASDGAAAKVTVSKVMLGATVKKKPGRAKKRGGESTDL